MYFGYKILQFNLYWKIESKKKKKFFLKYIFLFSFSLYLNIQSIILNKQLNKP